MKAFHDFAGTRSLRVPRCLISCLVCRRWTKLLSLVVCLFRRWCSSFGGGWARHMAANAGSSQPPVIANRLVLRMQLQVQLAMLKRSIMAADGAAISDATWLS